VHWGGRSHKTCKTILRQRWKPPTLAPDQPLVQVELVEARLFVSGDPRITPEMVATLEQAVSAEPTLQKGLWLLGIAAAQQGDDVRALEWWEKLRAQIEPGSQIEQSVLEQMDQARVRLGKTSQPAVTPPMAAAPVTTAGGKLRSRLAIGFAAGDGTAGN
jgi:cytochrome c-type biogenesis protein CcmH